MGLETARALGKYGPVLVGGRSEKKLGDALKSLDESGIEAYGHPCDISDRASVEEFANHAGTIGDMGCVVNAAGVFSDTASVDMIEAVNVAGAINMTDVFGPLLHDGVFVHFTSVTGYMYEPEEDELAVWASCGEPGFPERWRAAVNADEPETLEDGLPYYASSKRWLMYYTRANTTRFAAEGNRIFSVAPGSYDTPMFQDSNSTADGVSGIIPLGRVGRPEEMGLLVAQLAGPGHDYLTGTDILADGGMLAATLTPQLTW